MSVNESLPIINIILLDEDPIFSLGLKEVCKDIIYQDINLVATGKLNDLFSFVKNYNYDLIAIGLDWENHPDKVKKFFQDLPLLATEYPESNLLLMLNPKGLIYDLTSLSIIKGYCYKNIHIDELITIIRTCAKGEQYFNNNKFFSKKEHFNSWLSRQCQLGIKEIEQQIKEIDDYTKNRNLTSTDLIYWQGRKRELKFAKWLITRFLSEGDRTFLNFQLNVNQKLTSEEKFQTKLNPVKNKQESKLQSSIIITNHPLNSHELTLTKLQNSVDNLTGKIQAIDILKNNIKKELLITILQEWQEIIREIKQLKLEEKELGEKTNTFIKELWQNSVLKFLGRYLPNNNPDSSPKNLELVNLTISQGEIINNNQQLTLPFLKELIFYEVNKKPIIIDTISYNYGEEASQEIEEIILQNSVITMANSIIEFVLNQFADDPILKKKLFKPELKSSRKVAMFRNNLVWQYRLEKYWQNPKNIFEDQYEMLKLNHEGIISCQITHPRYQELNTIQGIPWGVTILIELRDSLSKGVKSLGDSLGKLLVYLLTEVIGKAIGLIGKGILQGIGSRMKN